MTVDDQIALLAVARDRCTAAAHQLPDGWKLTVYEFGGDGYGTPPGITIDIANPAAGVGRWHTVAWEQVETKDFNTEIAIMLIEMHNT